MSTDPVEINLDLSSDNRGLELVFWLIFFTMIFGSIVTFYIIYINYFGLDLGFYISLILLRVVLIPVFYPNMRSIIDPRIFNGFGHPP